MKETGRKILFFICMTVMTGCCIYAAAWFINGQMQKNGSKAMAEQFHGQEAGTEQLPAAEQEEDKERNRKEEMNRLTELNADLVGWITIDGTGIDYPVVQAQDNQFYLTQNFEREKDRHGAIFMDFRCRPGDWENTILYGHHMKDGTMFRALSDYKKEEFYESHQKITFYDCQGVESNYEIISVFYWDGEKEDSFPFHHYIGLSEESFYEYIGKVREKSLYDIPLGSADGQKLLTLATCDYLSVDARLIVVGREMIRQESVAAAEIRE